MKRYAFIVAAATMLSGCIDRQHDDCISATRTKSDYNSCIRDSNKAQYKAHRIVVKKYMAESE